jgi:hypothetical protein
VLPSSQARFRPLPFPYRRVDRQIPCETRDLDASEEVRDGRVDDWYARKTPWAGPARWPVIATIKVLGLRARDIGTVAAAARRVVTYVQGGRTGDSAASAPEGGLAGYYTGSDDRSAPAGAGTGTPAAGRARGAAAGLVGLPGAVTGAQLQRLLTGRHARTGRALLTPTGSAGRAAAGRAGPGRGEPAAR